tara:strand:- start:4597 stop:4818 length:222 start_codon:yes stop_codon:yes gene_type:complete
MEQEKDKKFNKPKINFERLPSHGIIKHFPCQWCGVAVHRTDGNCLHCFKSNDVHKSDLKKGLGAEVMDMFKDG